MHHALRFYSRYREWFLRYYIFQAKWTRIPLIGRLVRKIANTYGKKGSGAYFLTVDEACQIVDSSSAVALGPCSCRSVFRNCDNPIETEIMLGTARNIFIEHRPQEYREITREEAKEIIRKCHERGLIHTIVRCREDFYALCNCCSCCCVPLRLRKDYGIGNAAVRSENIVEQFRERRI